MSSDSPAGRASSSRVGVLRMAGPGLVVAATGIGSGDVVSATVAGANYGVVLLWAIALGAFFKFVLNEGIARWQLATGKTALEGWADHLPAWVPISFGVYLIVWTVAVSAALTNATGLGIANLTGGAISQPWGAVLHSLVGFTFVVSGGYARFEKLMKLLVGIMGFSTLVPLPFAFTGRPLFVIITYTIVGSLFIPFLAATLLYMNTRIPWTAEVPRNHWTTNVLLVIVLAVFLAVGLQEIDGILR